MYLGPDYVLDFSDFYTLHPWPSTTIGFIVFWARAVALTFVHAPLPTRKLEQQVLVDHDPALHILAAHGTPHPLSRSWDLEGSASFVLFMLAKHRHDVVRMRLEVVQEIADLSSDLSEDFNAWFEDLEPDLQQAYTANKVNVPLFLHLLRAFGYPDADQLELDFTFGFDVIGDIPSGAGWPPNNQDQPALGFFEFAAANDSFICAQLRTRVASRCTDVLLHELQAEVAAGRVRGPFELPHKWGSSAAHLEGTSNLPAPADPACFASFAFPYHADWVRGGAKGEAG